MFRLFYFLQSVWFLEIYIPFCEYSMPLPVRKAARLQYLSYINIIHLASGRYSFSCLLNPDWSIQISGALVVCKAVHGK